MTSEVPGSRLSNFTKVQNYWSFEKHEQNGRSYIKQMEVIQKWKI